MSRRPSSVLVPAAPGGVATARAGQARQLSDGSPLVAPSVAATAGPAPSTAPLTVVSTTAAGAAPTVTTVVAVSVATQGGA